MADERTSRLYLQNERMLMDYIRALVRNTDDTEDILQETGLTILSKARVPDDDQVFPKWARGVARNVVMHFWRARQRAKVVADSTLVDLVDQSFDEADEESELMARRRAALPECLKQVREPSRNILQMRYTQGLSCERIASLVKKTPGSLRVMLMRIRSTIQACIESKTAGENA